MKLYKFNIFLCSVLILTIAVINLVLPKTETVSIAENRNLAIQPEFSLSNIFKGDYFKAYDAYFSDHFIGRDRLVTVAKKIQSYSGKRSESVGEIVINRGENILSSHSGSGSTAKNIPNPTNILYLKDRAMTIYRFNKHNSDAFIKSYNKMAESVPSDIQLTTFLVPDQIEFSTLDQTRNLADSQKKALEYYETHLDQRTLFINAIPSLLEHKDEYLYFRTDHHWTARGAYYAYLSYANAHGFETLPLSSYTSFSAEGFLGSRYRLNKTLEPYPDTIEYFVHPEYSNFTYEIFKDNAMKVSELLNTYFLKTESQYAMFMGGDHPVATLQSENKNGQVLLVIKDSFANAFVPFLAPHYEKIIVLDPRHRDIDLNEAIQTYKPTEILFLNTIHSASKSLNVMFDDFIK